MEELIVNREKLLFKVRQNSDLHKEIYNLATVKYKEALLSAFEDKVSQLRSDSKEEVIHSVDVPVPQSHLEEYDVAIQMLEWNTEAEVELSKQEFENLVMDKWHWSSNFMMCTSGTYGINLANTETTSWNVS